MKLDWSLLITSALTNFEVFRFVCCLAESTADIDCNYKTKMDPLLLSSENPKLSELRFWPVEETENSEHEFSDEDQD